MTKITDLVKQAMDTIFVPIHPAGWPFILIFAFVSILLAMVEDTLGFIGLILTAWCVYFFRNPDRTVPQREGLIVSPADGMVSLITKAPLPAELEALDETDTLYSGQELTRVSVFLNVFDVHVNRNPIAGTVTQAVYHPGKFLNATLDKASSDNERNTLVVKIKDQPNSIAFVQIAGLVARRILCDAKVGDTLKTGERYGMIRFGSRTDIYLPPGVEPMVSVGQRMIGGESVIADMKSDEAARTGEIV